MHNDISQNDDDKRWQNVQRVRVTSVIRMGDPRPLGRWNVDDARAMPEYAQVISRVRATSLSAINLFVNGAAARVVCHFSPDWVRESYEYISNKCTANSVLTSAIVTWPIRDPRAHACMLLPKCDRTISIRLEVKWKRLLSTCYISKFNMCTHTRTN